MSDKQIYGKSFEFDNDFFSSQKQIGFVKLYQLGEVCFESGHEVELHRQVCHEITYIISGKALVTCGDTSYRVGQGDIVINAKGQMHAIQADSDSKLRYFYLGFDFDREMHNEMTTRLASFYEDKFNSRVAHDEYNLITCFGRLLDEMYNSMDFSESLLRKYI